MNSVMKFASAAIGAAALAMCAAAPAQAAVTYTNVNLIGGSSIFGATTDEAGSFTHTFNFTTYALGDASSAVVTISLNNARDIDFSAIDLDGNPFTLSTPDPSESWSLTNVLLGSGSHTITLYGTVAATPSHATASYSGVLNIAAVPEPATWGLMIMGFGGMGAMLRTRRRSAATFA